MKHKPIIFIGIVVAAIIWNTQFSDFTIKLNPQEKRDGLYNQKYHRTNLILEKRNPLKHIIYLVEKNLNLKKISS